MSDNVVIGAELWRRKITLIDSNHFLDRVRWRIYLSCKLWWRDWFPWRHLLKDLSFLRVECMELCEGIFLRYFTRLRQVFQIFLILFSYIAILLVVRTCTLMMNGSSFERFSYYIANKCCLVFLWRWGFYCLVSSLIVLFLIQGGLWSPSDMANCTTARKLRSTYPLSCGRHRFNNPKLRPYTNPTQFCGTKLRTNLLCNRLIIVVSSHRWMCAFLIWVILFLDNILLWRLV